MLSKIPLLFFAATIVGCHEPYAWPIMLSSMIMLSSIIHRWLKAKMQHSTLSVLHGTSRRYTYGPAWLKVACPGTLYNASTRMLEPDRHPDDHERMHRNSSGKSYHDSFEDNPDHCYGMVRVQRNPLAYGDAFFDICMLNLQVGGIW